MKPTSAINLFLMLLLIAGCAKSVEVGATPEVQQVEPTVVAEATPNAVEESIVDEVLLPTTPPAPTPSTSPEPTAPVDTTGFVQAQLQTPDGHELVVVDLPFAQALGGNVRPGELVTVVAVRGPVGEPSTGYEVGAFEVVNVEARFDGEALGPETVMDDDVVRTLAVTVAVEPFEAVDLADARAGGTIMLAAKLGQSDDYAMYLELARDRVVEGGVRPGDAVSIVDGAVLLLTDVAVLNVVSTQDPAAERNDADFYGVTVSVERGQLGPIAAAIAAGDIRLI